MATKWKKFNKSIPVKLALWFAAAAISVAGLSVAMDFAGQMSNQEYYFYSDQFFTAVKGQFTKALAEMDGAETGNAQDGVYYYAVAGGQVYTNAHGSVLTEIKNALTVLPGESGLMQEETPSVDSEGGELNNGEVSLVDTGAPAPIEGVSVELYGHQLPLYNPADYTWDELAGSNPYSLHGCVFVASPDGFVSLEGGSWDYADMEIAEWLTQWLSRPDIPAFDFILVYQPVWESSAVQSEYAAAYEQQLMDGYIVPCLLLLGALAAVCLWLMVTAGRSAKDGKLHLVFVDHCPVEILALGLVVLGMATWNMVFWLARMSYAYVSQGGGQMLAAPERLLRLALPTALGLLMLALVLGIVRQAKARMLWRSSLCGRIVSPLVTGRVYLRHCPPAARMAKRIPAVFLGCMALWMVAIVVVSEIGSYSTLLWALLFGCIAALGGMIYLYRMQLRDSQGVAALLEQVQAATKGETVNVKLPPDNAFYEICQTAQLMGRNIQENVDARLKSERMKLDLITNVSHDLKTPLTSIIGYVDLLEKQNLAGEAADYVKILRKKADRLSDTVQDLFTLAKSTSGSEPTPLQRRDLVMAVHQVLADMEDRLADGAPVRMQLPEAAPVLAESAKLYRILQNLLDNAIRYSLAGTRIYLCVAAGPQATVLTIKNTASYEMDFTAEEIMQRFARGDKSRTSEGSGLGLSIVESFMGNFGGAFALKVDGDQFVVQCTFQTAPEALGQGETDGIDAVEPVAYDDGGQMAAGSSTHAMRDQMPGFAPESAGQDKASQTAQEEQP